ncbi:peroxiredoxin family protein [Pedobacter nutrimenti]|jgi:cytochrome oxidase Cu insertion factor (SCO1/SenC/PrrC family)|uniref:AhpC/TSA family protein n=1 Tax=Pedobacter nutrimenti TaxID=1241337 RepID=A0A318UC40_9SPHI|nr:redoxin domain-containing protein [Pedobacter nutrimenti]PYF73946.1 AhpC/TSA family protein [Pedobacter nutrimenti]|eukprot:gene16457-19572_t
MKNLISAVVFLLFVYSAKAQDVSPSMPDFKFYTAGGAGFTKQQVPGGKGSLIVFFDATCPHCQKVVSALSKKVKELSKVNVYLVSLDEFRTIDYFMEHYGKALTGLKNVTLLQDKDHIFIPLFKPSKYPSVYVYAANKKLKFYTSGEIEVNEIFNKF